jgi:hypothetical protein
MLVIDTPVATSSVLSTFPSSSRDCLNISTGQGGMVTGPYTEATVKRPEGKARSQHRYESEERRGTLRPGHHAPPWRKRMNLCLSQLRLFSEKTGRPSKLRKPVWNSSLSLDRIDTSSALACLLDR